MTAHNIRKKRSRLQQDFIPNFEIRSVLVIATFALGAVAAHAQPVTTPLSTTNNKPQVAVTAVTDRSDSATKTVAQKRSSRSQLDAAFNRADRNGDGKLSREEAEHFPVLVQRFDLIDSNRDSFLSRDEFEKAAGD